MKGGFFSLLVFRFDGEGERPLFFFCRGGPPPSGEGQDFLSGDSGPSLDPLGGVILFFFSMLPFSPSETRPPPPVSPYPAVLKNLLPDYYRCLSFCSDSFFFAFEQVSFFRRRVCCTSLFPESHFELQAQGAAPSFLTRILSSFSSRSSAPDISWG